MIAIGVAPPLFGQIHRGVGALHQLGRVVPIFRIKGDPDAGSGKDFVAAKHERLGECALDAQREGFGVGLVGILDQDGELVSAEAGKGVLIAQATAQAASELAQQVITDIVAERIVDILEVVQIDKHQHQLFLIALRPVQRMAQAVEQQGTVGQAGQFIMQRQILHPPPGFDDLRDVGENAGVIDDLAAFIRDRADCLPFGEQFAVTAAVLDLALPHPTGLQRIPHLPVEGQIMTTAFQDARRLADDFGRRIAGNGGEGTVDRDDAFVRVGDHHRFGCAFDHHRGQPQLRFSQAARSDVHRLETLHVRFAMFVRQDKAQHLQASLSIWSGYVFLGFKRRTAIERLELDLGEVTCNLGFEQVAIGLSDHVFSIQSECLDEDRVGENVTAVEVLERDQDGRVLEHRVDALLACAQRPFRVESFRLIQQCHHRAAQLVGIAVIGTDPEQVVASSDADRLLYRARCLQHLLDCGTDLAQIQRAAKV